MLQFMFSVYDSKAEIFMPPFFMQSRGAALRSFTEVCNDRNHNFFKWPADFTLFELGSFEDGSGIVLTHKTPISLGLAQEFKDKVVGFEQ